MPVYAKGTSRDGGGRPAPQSGGLRRRVFDLPLLIQSIRVTTGASPAVSIERLSALHGTDRQPGTDPAGLFVGRHVAAVDAGRRPGAALVGQPQDRGYRLAGARHADGRRFAGDGLRPRGCGHRRRHAADAVARDLSRCSQAATRGGSSLANRRVLELAQTDILTGLPNRAFFLTRLDMMNSQSSGGACRSRS